MALQDFLSENRNSILERWYRLILETYPDHTSRFLKREKDRFVNPVGHTISREIEALYDEFLWGMDVGKLSTSLENVIRIRSVQDFSPSEAIAFVLLLKKAVRETLESETSGSQVSKEWSGFESRIDRLVLLAFDIYMECREKIHEIKLKEVFIFLKITLN